MSQFLTPYFAQTALARELQDHDARQLRDIGLTRGLDGSLRLAEDPSQLAVPVRAQSRLGALPQLLRNWNLPAGLGQIFLSRR